MVTSAMLLAYALVLVLPSVGAATVALALSRPHLGLFTTTETTTNLLGHERYRFRSRWHRRAFGALTVGSFFLLFVFALFAADAFLVD
ncbi:MAG: hypothetical protein ABEJ43_06065 [Haloferacaceae archaeon]